MAGHLCELRQIPPSPSPDSTPIPDLPMAGGDLDLSGEKGRGSGFLKLGTEAEARLLTHIFKDYLNLSESLKLFIVLF